ncbi:Stk1 family PASTA domain-containing Ser/Thr kinase [Collinsella tanakaei]|uniref:Stk1 family PASTA domain-containing Ser/Thr kinase n=1 Tax=Collinsella tanakaei TaxID=626935 RepID=UPI0025A470BB|nr:Stk1 family PASTA domain-containing Ser/Thr kinase [Collinsella tanakaei]MDM8299322.1 Stk1 family PASTA domain-containing Ser/Thr kinase [Collinsella tanakaei]
MAEQQQLLGGRYLLKDKVGAGGMASVYRAIDQVLDRTVAIKIMLPQYAGDPTFAARFKQEAQAAAGLQSPYIVGVYDWGKDGDTYYIVMEYLRGTDLKSGIRSHGALDPKKVAQIGSQICGALSVAHKHEIVHRDIKPQNIMVQPDGNIKVMDFGIARAKNSQLTQDNNVLGTAHYVSPEQTRGQELGPTSDIYSLGVVMYECATGQVPFDGEDAISVALKQVNELPVPPSQINPNVDGDLERIILKCMEKDPANRFQTAEELRRVLSSYLAGRTVDVPEPTRVIATSGATATRAMSDQTQAMARPVGGAAAVNTTARTAVGQIDSSAYENKRDGMSKGKIAGIAVAVIAVVAIAIFAVSGLLAPAKMVKVPNVVGLDQQTAVDAIRQAGFEPGEITPGYSHEYPEGQVMEQHPTQNDDGTATAAEGSEIDIVVSQGEEPAETTEVPDLSEATSRDEAERLIRAAGLEPDATEKSDEAEAGTILDQNPKAGEEVEVGSKVSFTVSTGPNTTSVPDLTGCSESEARDALDSADFGMSVTREYSDTVQEGYVISWNPSGKQEPGTTITVVISRGPDMTTQETPVPDLTGMSKAAAEDALESAGFVADVSYADGQSAGVDPDHVISWDPSGSAAPGTTIHIVVAWDVADSGESTDTGETTESTGARHIG